MSDYLYNNKEIEELAREVSVTSPIGYLSALESISSYIHQAMCLGYSLDQGKEFYKKGVPLQMLIKGELVIDVGETPQGN